MIPITSKLVTNSRTRPAINNKTFYSLRKLKGVVAHWTANTGAGADADAHYRYFNRTHLQVSAHYFVDDKTIIQIIPDDEVAWHVGGRYYKSDGERIKEGDLSPNYFLIGFEMCVNADGNWNKTYQNAVDLAAHLLNKYSLSIKDLYRHYDITGKDCPKMMVGPKDGAWTKFKSDVQAKLSVAAETPLRKVKVDSPTLNVRKGPGASHAIVGVLRKGDETNVYEERGKWYRVGMDRWIHGGYTVVLFERQIGYVKVDDPEGLNARSGPGVNFPVLEALPNGTEVSIINKSGSWLEIGNNRWVFGAYIQIQADRRGLVVVPEFLNVRKGPGTQFERVERLPNGTEVDILEDLNGWFRIGKDQWVFGAFVKPI